MTKPRSINRSFALLTFVAVVAGGFLAPGAQARGHRSHEAAHRSRAALSDPDGPATPDEIQPYLTGAFPHPRSQYCALMDASSGKLIFAINPDTRREPASLTKIMAATVLLENGKLSDTVIAPQDVKDVPESSLHLRPGERLSLEDLLYAMLLRSANDTPVAGASYLAGSVPKFVDLMNRKAAEIGCKNTHFVTPNGLYDPEHYSCARDLALMARYAAGRLPMFDEIVKTQKYRVHRSIDQNDTLVTNTAASYLKYFPGADGIKTGYISQAGHCFVGSATRGGWRLIAVALNSPKCREDVMGMLSYGYAHFAPVTAIPKGTPEGSVTLSGSNVSVPVATAADLDDVVSKDHPAVVQPVYTTVVAPLAGSAAKLPIHAGERVGTVTLFADGKPVTTTEAVAVHDVAAPPAVASMMNLSGSLSNLGKITGIAALAVGVLTLMALTALKFYAGALAKNSRRRRSRVTTHLRAMD